MIEFPNDNLPPDEDMPALYMAIGALVIAWGSIEGTLNLMIALIYHDIGGRKEAEILPFVLKDKLSFIRKCLTNIKPLKPHKKVLWTILEGIGRHNRIRVGVIHGYLSGYDPQTGRVGFTKIDGGGVIHTVSNTVGTITELAQAGVALIDLGHKLSTAMTNLSAAFDGQNPRHDPGR